MKKKYTSQSIAVCGVMGAFSTVIMLMGGMIPLATFVAPCISGIILIPLTLELGFSNGFLIYIGISLLSIIMVPDKEMAFIFIFFLGYYPILKLKLDKIKNKFIEIFVKFIIFNFSIFAMYWIILYVFPIYVLVEEFNQYSNVFVIILIILANFTFLVYDLAVKKVTIIYNIKYRKKIIKNKHL